MLTSNKTIFYINSSNRINGTHSNFNYKLQFNDNIPYDRVVVLQATIPKSYYLVQDGKNTFTLVHGLSSYTITVPAGNYGRTTFQSTILSLLNAASSFVYAISYPSSTARQTGKFTFTVSNNASVQPSFVFTDYLYECFGFNENSTNTFSGNSLTSENIIKLQAEDTIFIHSDICQNENDNVLQEIYAADNPNFANITFVQNNLESYSKHLTTTQNNIYNFQITNENDVELELNGLNVNLTLMLYQEDNLNTFIKNFLKLQLAKN